MNHIYIKLNFQKCPSQRACYFHQKSIELNFNNSSYIIVYFLGECFSNDPANPKGPKLRTWQEPIGSIRPIRGMDCTSLRAVVTMEWDKLKSEHKMEIVETNEVG